MTEPTTPTPADAASNFREQVKPASGLKTGTTKVVAALVMIGGALDVVLGAAQLISGRAGGRAVGAVNLAAGALGSGVGKAVWDTASSATRTRNYVELQDQLNAMNPAQSRA